MQEARPGELMDQAPHIPEIDLAPYRMQVSTERYRSRDYYRRERERLWMRVWQVAGRADELPQSGDWMVHSIFDQSFVLVRGRDGAIRGFVNACRHRGNAFCQGKGRSARFTCPYHNWSYGLDGQCLAVAKPDYQGPVEEFVGEKSELGLIEVRVECFAGFIFINPDRNARPLAEFFGEAGPQIAAYRLEEMIVTGLNVREPVQCNWKVVVDAFQEAYHVQGVHPELVPMVNLAKERCGLFGDHAATTVPFGAPGQADTSPEEQFTTIMELPAPNFPGLVEVLPRFEELAANYRQAGGRLEFPEGVSALTLLQHAVRESLTGKGLDVSQLTDSQMSDYQFWHMFPNVYMQLRAGEATVVMASPHANGEPDHCMWHVYNLEWFPPAERERRREPLRDIGEGEHFPYFLALEQDFQQMEVQQRGLKNSALEYLMLTRQEPKIAHFHSTLDSWIDGGAQG